MNRGPFTFEEFSERRGIARAVVSEGGGLRAFAARCGVTHQAATAWIQRNDADLHRQLKEARPKTAMACAEALQRLVVIRDFRARGMRDSRIAKELGISHPGLIFWLRRWAADGVDMAIEELSPEADEPNGKRLPYPDRQVVVSHSVLDCAHG